MEDRVRRFQDLHANKWFHLMNWVLDSLKMTGKQRYMHVKFAKEFYL
uniref:Uncharacterized protein n=1 Tax=viral metagenome TaxID=1070528 RepID=A0A6C0B2U4_9ZZZZ